MKQITIPITRSSSNIPPIPGALYGTGKSAVILSNMDTNGQAASFHPAALVIRMKTPDKIST